MFGSWLGGKFSNKCKHAVKCVKLRLVPIRKKKQAVLRFLKKDVADLIASGHEANAFRRIDALIVEINRTSCYDMIEQFCECILSQLPTLQKQRECPQEAVEAISTLIFAAARFPDLPELCSLRHVFVERYGSYMESAVNAEFVKKNHRSFSREKKIQVMQSIAEEFSVSWDVKAFDHRSCHAPALNSAQHTEAATPSPMETEPKDIRVISTSSNGQSLDLVEKTTQDVDTTCLPRSRTEEQSELDCSPEKKQVVSVKPWSAKPVNMAPPPYTKPNGAELDEIKNDVEEKNGHSPVKSNGRVAYLIPPYVKTKVTDVPTEGDQTAQNIVVVAGDDKSRDEKPKPISVRTKLRKPPVTDTDDDEEKPTSHAPGGHDGQYDEEGVVMDKHSLHHGRKGTAKETSRERTRAATPTADQDRVQHPGNGKIHPVPSETLLQPDPTNSGGRVHPRLPDYDLLAERFAALKK